MALDPDFARIQYGFCPAFLADLVADTDTDATDADYRALLHPARAAFTAALSEPIAAAIRAIFSPDDLALHINGGLVLTGIVLTGIPP
jgi:hypothetical protein